MEDRPKPRRRSRKKKMALDLTDVRALNGNSAALLTFAERAAQIENVQMVAALNVEHAVNVWTVLASDDRERTARDRVYDLEYDFRREFPATKVEFRVIDASEYPTVPPTSLVPDEAQPLIVNSD